MFQGGFQITKKNAKTQKKPKKTKEELQHVLDSRRGALRGSHGPMKKE
jgi:hypothetical protein